jgi:hypothetical protein
MKPSVLSAALAALVFLGLADVASADIVFTFSNLELSTSSSGSGANNAGSMSGTIDFGSSLTNTPISWDITTTAAGSYPSVEYTNTVPGATAGNYLNHATPYLRFDQDTNDELQLSFTGAVTASGGTFLAGAQTYSEDAGGPRYMTGSASLTPAVSTPEPSAAVLVVLGATLGGGGMWYRRNKRSD